jgi:hypothetical protein
MRTAVTAIVTWVGTLAVLAFVVGLAGWAGPLELALTVLASTAVAAFVVMRVRRTAN